MKKEQFIKNLRYSLRKLKKDEREKYLAYYEEIISDMIENGVSEEEAVAHQGETKRIAEEILRENAVKRESKIGWIGTVLIILTLLCGMVSGYLIYQEYQIKSGIEKLQGELAEVQATIAQYENCLETMREKETYLEEQIQLEEFKVVNEMLRERDMTMEDLKEMLSSGTGDSLSA